MKKTLIILIILFGCTDNSTETLYREGDTYYISNVGNNSNNGLSEESPWMDETNINSMDARDVTFKFISGGTFGTLIFDEMDNGVEITSYNGERAVINGINIKNSSDYKIHNIDITVDGITIRNTLSGGTKISNFDINNVEVSDAYIGILIIGTNDTSGVKNVNISNTTVRDCIEGGIYSKGYFATEKVGYSHQNIHLFNCTVYNVSGYDNGAVNTHTGNGIMLSDVEFSSIVDCTAYNNGYANTNCGGPVGIWYWDSKDVLIQGCESYQNHTIPPGCDGAGFDFDGGVVNGIMQYNYSHDNDGGGFLVGQFQYSRRMENITVRYNISVNDGNTNGGSIYLFNYAGNDSMQDVFIYNNTTIQDNKPTFKSLHNFSNDNVILVNNIFGGAVQNTDRATFLENYMGTPDFIDGYHLPEGSPLIDVGVNLEWNIGDYDFYGNPSLTGSSQDFGAHEYQGIILNN